MYERFLAKLGSGSGLLGAISTSATFFPRLQIPTILRFLGIAAIFVGYVVANYRVYARYANGVRARRQELLDELRFNAGRLQTITAVTASELRAEGWQAASATSLGISETLRSRVNNFYMNVRRAKEIKQTINAVPVGRYWS